MPRSSEQAAPRPWSPARLRALRRGLLAFYDGQRRELPWRATRDPWAILVSEIMLQQTTVSAVVPYWRSFLERWPDPRSLAAAGRDEVLAAWAGLGYYRRARSLMDAAAVVAEAGGVLPRDAAGLRRLPGVGEYTAAAVASIAYGEAVAVVDGNVERVLCRLLALPGDPRRAPAKGLLREAAALLLDPQRPGDANQAIMELGALVCRPRTPDCGRCPLRRACQARTRGEVERFPESAPRAASSALTTVAALVERRGRVLLRRRQAPPNAGFHELPGVTLGAARLDRRGAPREGAADLARALAREHGLILAVGEALPVQRHAITRWRLRVHPYRATLSSGAARPPLAWIDPDAPDVPITTATRRILEQARGRTPRQGTSSTRPRGRSP